MNLISWASVYIQSVHDIFAMQLAFGNAFPRYKIYEMILLKFDVLLGGKNINSN